MSDTVTLTLEELEEIKAQLVEMDAVLTRLLAQPLVYATVVKADNKFHLDAFEQGDRMLVIDKNLRKQKKFYGKIASQGVDDEGWVILEYPTGGRDRLNIGLNGELPQVKLIGKDDGTNVVIAHDGKLFEVHGLPGKEFHPSSTVKVDMETKQIHDDAGVSAAGDVAYIKTIVDEEHVEVESNGHSRVVIHGVKDEEGESVKIEPGDRVMLDHTNTITVRVLEKDNADRFNLIEQQNVTWDQIAGLGDVKESLVEALELPYQHPDIFKFYNKKPPKGVLLYGPPGCGKTLCAKAAANSMARIHGKENYQSGFIYVKGPELLSKWVGQTEAEIRQLFVRGREHYKKHGYPALLFIDEADAILPMRGSGKSSDVENTIVPMFLSEMDGLEEAHLMVLLATNQPKRLDPAVTREGRVDRKVRVGRPTAKNAHEYFNLHMKGIPVAEGFEAEELTALTIRDLFSEKRGLYTVQYKKQTHLFKLGDAVSGSMIATIVDHATSQAMKRDLHAGTQTGVNHTDFQDAVNGIFKHHVELNPTFDLEEFCDANSINRNEATFSKLVHA
jgi:proteasome-associated ATPase